MKKVIGIVALGLITMAFVIKEDSKSTSVKSEVNRGALKQISNMQNEVKSSKVPDGAGIKFKNISLAKAKESAAENDQLIFIDAYTSWCGPCKKMAATSFMNEEVGELFNEKFINLKIDCEKDVDGPEIARLYKVRVYPTLLIIDSQGKLIKEVHGFQPEDKLIALAKSVD